MGCGSSSSSSPSSSSSTLVPTPQALAVDLNQDGKISRDELAKFIERNSHLWAMLSVNLNIPEQRCRDIATDVAYQMAKKKTSIMSSLRDMSESTKAREPTVQEFQSFLTMVHPDNPKGQQEFFHRTVFATYDVDGNGYIDNHELDKFLNVFYEAGSIFAGDVRLPDKETLKRNVLHDLDVNGDGKLEFQELRILISGGGAGRSTLTRQ
jgi:Ca2+-binding EF-hand superfamily protein